MNALPDTDTAPDFPRKPTPRSTFTGEYWAATRDRRLLVQHSAETDRFQFFPQPISQGGSRRDLEWRHVEPVGELFAYTVTHLGPGLFRGREPYVVATVTLDAGVRMISNLVDCPADRIAIGMRVRGTWLPLSDGTHLLQFRPDETGAEAGA